MLQILDPHEDVCSEEGEQCNDYLRLRRLDISCVLKCIDCCCKVSLIRNVINATHIHTYTRIHAHNAHINTHAHVCMCVCVLFICVCVCIHVHTHSHICNDDVNSRASPDIERRASESPLTPLFM